MRIRILRAHRFDIIAYLLGYFYPFKTYYKKGAWGSLVARISVTVLATPPFSVRRPGRKHDLMGKDKG